MAAIGVREGHPIVSPRRLTRNDLKLRCRDTLRGHTSANEMTHAISTELTYTRGTGDLHFVDDESSGDERRGSAGQPVGRLAGWLMAF